MLVSIQWSQLSSFLFKVLKELNLNVVISTTFPHTIMYVNLWIKNFYARWNIASLYNGNNSQIFLRIFCWNISIIPKGNKWQQKHNILLTTFVRTLFETIITDYFPLWSVRYMPLNIYIHIFIRFTLCWRLIMMSASLPLHLHSFNIAILNQFVFDIFRKF